MREGGEEREGGRSGGMRDRGGEGQVHVLDRN